MIKYFGFDLVPVVRPQTVSSHIDSWFSGGFYARPYALMFVMLSVPTVLFLGSNAFGIRRRQGRRYATAFEAAQACGTARLACLKVRVRSVCVLAALIPVVVSVWVSLSLSAGGKGFAALRAWQRAIEGSVGALTGYQQIALAVVESIGVAVTVAALAATWALAARYPVT